VSFTGFLADRELAALLAAADVAVVPSLYEPFGMVALEAAALGVPRVVAGTGGLGELVDPGVTGLRFTAGDPAALADAVSAVLRDPVGARRMARAARAVVARDHRWPEIARRTVEVYERAGA
jgi:glycogen(starch) synthase